VFVFLLQRPPSSSLSYPGPGNDDVRSPGSGGTPGPLSQQPSSQQSVDNSDPGKRGDVMLSLLFMDRASYKSDIDISVYFVVLVFVPILISLYHLFPYRSDTIYR